MREESIRRVGRVVLAAFLSLSMLAVIVAASGCNAAGDPLVSVEQFEALQADSRDAWERVEQFRAEQAELRGQLEATRDALEALPPDAVGRDELVEVASTAAEGLAEIESKLTPALRFAEQADARLQAAEGPEDLPAVGLAVAADAAREWGAEEWAPILGLASTTAAGLAGLWRQRRRAQEAEAARDAEAEARRRREGELGAVVASVDLAKTASDKRTATIDLERLAKAQDRLGVRDTVRAIRKDG